MSTRKKKPEASPGSAATLPPARPAQELMAKPPPGFRPLTDQEQRRLEDASLRAELAASQIRATTEAMRRAELEKGALEAERRGAFARQVAVADEMKELNNTLQVEKVEDMTNINGRTWVRIRKAKDKTPAPSLAIK